MQVNCPTTVYWIYIITCIWYDAADTDFCVGVKVKLWFLSTGIFMCNMQSTLWKTKHGPCRGLHEDMPTEIFEKYMLCNWIWCFLRHNITVLRTGSVKFVIWGISLAVHAKVVNPEGGKSPSWPYPESTPDIALTMNLVSESLWTLNLALILYCSKYFKIDSNKNHANGLPFVCIKGI